MSKRNSVINFIHSLDDSDIRLTKPACTVKQMTRFSCVKRPNNCSNFIHGNLRFVYKNASQIKSEKQIDELNDVLFSHTIFPQTGPQWNLLFCVVGHEDDDYVCPICLFKPCAPLVTKCGHIFCADCMKKLLEYSHVCPVCYEKLSGDEDLTKIKIHYHRKEEKMYTFKKIKRKKRLTICTTMDSSQEKLPKASDINGCFTTFTIADGKFVTEFYQNQDKEIQEQMKVYNEYHELERINLLKEISEEKREICEDDTEFSLTKDKTSDKYYYFYQEENGRLIFLDELTETILLREFETLSNAPDSFSAPLLSKKIIVLDEDNHSNAYSHLSYGAEIEEVFLDLKDIVSDKTIQSFKHSINCKIKSEKKKHQKSKTKKHVITKDDYQTFIPIYEKEVNFSSKADFPSFSSIPKMKQTRPPQKSPWGNLKINT